MKTLNKTIEYGLYLLVFLLPLQTRYILKMGELNGGGWEYGTISIYGTDILLLLVLFIFSFTKFSIFNFQFSNNSQLINSKNQEIKNQCKLFPKYWFLVAGLELFVFISIFVAPNKILALYKYIVFLLGVGLFWLIVSANYDRVKLLAGLLAGILLQAILGIWQFINQNAFASKWLGLSAHDPLTLGTSVVETLGGDRWLRAYGGMDHPNILAGLLVIGILVMVYLLMAGTEQKHKLPNFWKVVFLPFSFLVLAILFIALGFTFSRTGWLGLAGGIFVWLAILIVKKDWKAQRTMLLVILFFSIIGFSLYINYQELFATRLSQETRLEIKSNEERTDSYKIAKLVIKDNFWLGTGIGNYTLAVARDIKYGQPSWYYQPVHNVFLLVLAEIGVVGFIFFVLFLIYILISNFEFRISNQNSISNVSKLKNSDFIQNSKFKILKHFVKNINSNEFNTPLILSILVMFMFDHWWWSLHFGILLFWLCAGLIVKNLENKNTEIEEIRN